MCCHFPLSGFERKSSIMFASDLKPSISSFATRFIINDAAAESTKTIGTVTK